MKKTHIVLILLLLALETNAQSLTFEDTFVPSECVASGTGVLSVNAEHYKEGGQSLCWTSTGTSILNITFPSFVASTGNSAFLQIYSTTITNDTLTVEFLNATSVKKKAVFLCNYKGWHEFNRAYTEYASTLSYTITSVRITIKPTTSAARKTYLDDVDFNRTTEAGRIMGSQWVLDKKYLTSDISSLTLFANPVDLPITTPTAQELASLNSLRVTLKRTPTAGTTTTLAAAKAYATSLNIVRNSDGSVHGNVINTTSTALTDVFMTDIANKLEILAAAALTDAPTMTLFQNFLDHLLNQGISEGCNFMVFSNSYTACRVIPAAFLDALPACTASEKEEVLKLVRWMSFYGTMYYPQSTYLSNQVSDIIYLFLPHMMGIALNQADDATAVRELKAFKRYLERNTEYVPGGGDILKPDGTGFHHGTHYNNYMYAYLTWVQYIYYLKGTQFKISAEAYQRMKKAVISDYIMGTMDVGDTRFFANSLSGRNPFNTKVQFSKALFDNMVAIGADCLGITQDDEMASAYNYFFKTTKYSAPVQPYEGFYQFNYSPLGIFRKANWVASMHAPTTNFFGTEIYDNTNRFGRYQSYGSLEIMYDGTLASSGYPLSSATSGGWDWNVVPGATTVHYSSWQEMMPYKSVTGRFDQNTKTKNFSGALAFGDCGMFATDFDQIDTWSSSAYTATNLVFKKSMFAFDNMIISLGSNISSSGTYSTGMITATNLFQNIVPSGGLIFNGVSNVSPYTSTTTTTSDNWLITPLGTGYFIPKGNDPIEIKYDNQSTPNQNGADYAAPTTTVLAAKAYLSHGVKPSAKSYSFVVMPATNTAAMQTMATQMVNGGGSIYQILSQSSAVHALLYKPLNITAYSFFTAASNLSYGIVKSTTAEHLLMDKYDVNLNRHYFAISNPNLHPVTDATYGWIASPSQTTLTLVGDWKIISPIAGVVFSKSTNGQTQVLVTMTNGDPIYFGIKSPSDTTAINELYAQEWINFSQDKESIHLCFSKIEDEQLNVKIHSGSGQVIYNQNYNSSISALDIPVGKLQHGIFFCTVTNATQTKTYKWIR
ncbi:MAG: chondroitinase family polysaccharide lyase [Paludibacter sp.]